MFSADNGNDIKKIVITVIVGCLTLCVSLFLHYTKVIRRRGKHAIKFLYYTFISTLLAIVTCIPADIRSEKRGGFTW